MTGEGAMGVGLISEASCFWDYRSGGSDTPLNLLPVLKRMLLRRNRYYFAQKPAVYMVAETSEGEIDGHLN
jgi:hypothetical protein